VMEGERIHKMPEGWSEAILDDVAKWGSGGTPSRRTQKFYSGSIPWIKTGELGPKTIRKADEHITEEAIQKSSAKIFPKGSVGIAMYGATIGKLSIWGIDASTNQACAVAQPHEYVLNNEFLYYFLLSEKRGLINSGKGGAQPNISQGILKDWPILLPPLNEQRRIVAKIEELFSELDKGVESLKTARAQLKTYRQAVLKYAFEGKLTAKWREENKDKLEPAEKLLERIKTERETRHQQQLQDWQQAIKEWEDGGKEGKRPGKPKEPNEVSSLSAEDLARLPVLPVGYLYTYLANLGDLSRGKSKHRPRNDPQLFGGLYPFIQTGEIKAANRIVREFSQTYNETGLSQSKLWPKGTLCITIAANIAETAFLGFDGCFPDSVVGFSALDRLVLPEYVELFIKAVRVRIEAYAPATAQKNINLTTLEGLVVPLCSKAEQQFLVDEVESILSVVDENQSEIEDNLKRSEALRQSILKKAFSGQLVPQDDNDEPASVLLERIRAEKAAQTKTKGKPKAKAKKKSKRKIAA